MATVVTKYINGYGPYKYKVEYVDGEHVWTYLGPVDGSSGTGDAGNDVTNEDENELYDEAYDEFVREQKRDILEGNDESLEEAREKGHIHEEDLKQKWEVINNLDDDEIYVETPEWLAKEKVRSWRGRKPPTEFEAKVERETDDALLVKGSKMGTDSEDFEDWLPKSQIDVIESREEYE